MSDPETLTLRATAIAGQRHADDYAVIWPGMSVGRINRRRPRRLQTEIPEGMGADSREPDRSGYRRREADRGDQRRSARAV
jgi:hypothetical protein